MNHIEMMKGAEVQASLSVCKRAKVGAVLVDPVTGSFTLGHNHRAFNNDGWRDMRGCCEGEDGKTLLDVVHAERAAIEFAQEHGRDLHGRTLYVTRQPCIHCAQLITAAGIKSVYYRDADDKDWGLRWLAWHGVQVDSGWILGQVQDSWAERNGVVNHG